MDEIEKLAEKMAVADRQLTVTNREAIISTLTMLAVGLGNFTSEVIKSTKPDATVQELYVVHDLAYRVERLGFDAMKFMREETPAQKPAFSDRLSTHSLMQPIR